jgi:multisubunit Na+/H+ antiporter MnhB subunit
VGLMTAIRWQLIAFQILSVLGVVIVCFVAAFASSVVEHWQVRELMRAFMLSSALGLVGLFASAWLLHRHPALRNSQSVMILVCGIALTAVQIVGIWMVLLPNMGY